MKQFDPYLDIPMGSPVWGEFVAGKINGNEACRLIGGKRLNPFPDWFEQWLWKVKYRLWYLRFGKQEERKTETLRQQDTLRGIKSRRISL